MSVVLTDRFARNLLESTTRLDAAHLAALDGKLATSPFLSRRIVSFQASKDLPVYGLYKFKEAFSPILVRFLLEQYAIKKGKLLDPFAGIGTTLFAGAELGYDADGIEILPICHEVVNARLLLRDGLKPPDHTRLGVLLREKAWTHNRHRQALNVIRITEGAYPPSTVESIERFLGFIKKEPVRVQVVLRLALLSVLESISYTRKDGQYLRWDYRAGRRLNGQKFDKGRISEFDDAITNKIEQLLHDIKPLPESLFLKKGNGRKLGMVQLLNGSCLQVLPSLRKSQYQAIITSPPYCNRYDYTRTYALELALLDLSDEAVIELRQNMLSATVENREKDLLVLNPKWKLPLEAAGQDDLLQSIIAYLEGEKDAGNLNNTGIPRMVRGYFYEMACVIYECHRVLKPGGWMFMVNDNVRYAGASISVDLILSRIAESLGFFVERILVLPNGKGNSSQQMGKHGKDSLRKCVYAWRKHDA